MDFMSDSLFDGRRVPMFNVIDDYNREALDVEPGPELSSDKGNTSA